MKALKTYELQLCNEYNANSVFEDHYQVDKTVSCMCGLFTVWATKSTVPKSSVLFVSKAYRNSNFILWLVFFILVGIAIAAGFTAFEPAIWVLPAILIVVLIVYLIISNNVVYLDLTLKHAATYAGPQRFFIPLGKDSASEAFELLSRDQLFLVRQMPSFTDENINDAIQQAAEMTDVFKSARDHVTPTGSDNNKDQSNPNNDNTMNI